MTKDQAQAVLFYLIVLWGSYALGGIGIGKLLGGDIGARRALTAMLIFETIVSAGVYFFGS